MLFFLLDENGELKNETECSEKDMLLYHDAYDEIMRIIKNTNHVFAVG